MEDLLTRSMQSLLIHAATALGPLVALLVGFAGTDWWLRWQLNEKYHHARQGDEAG
jgi:hypothetical protein